MVLLTKIRSHLSVILAVASSIFAGYAYISQLHYNVLAARMQTVELQNERMLSTNEQQSSIIDELTRQRVIDDKILRLLAEQQVVIKTQGEHIRNKLKELSNNDEKIHELFNVRLPPSAIELLNDQIRGSASENSTETASNPTN